MRGAVSACEECSVMSASEGCSVMMRVCNNNVFLMCRRFS